MGVSRVCSELHGRSQWACRQDSWSSSGYRGQTRDRPAPRTSPLSYCRHLTPTTSTELVSITISLDSLIRKRSRRHIPSMALTACATLGLHSPNTEATEWTSTLRQCIVNGFIGTLINASSAHKRFELQADWADSLHTSQFAAYHAIIPTALSQLPPPPPFLFFPFQTEPSRS